mmetsp:Transcript_1864/g.3514  ORF Transcript_1864/g.3514 Transcript_1864/m.3514 type:complete len:93 (-) Transcript_1864:710-988(-)|eukprot:CAMPEP_0197695064 /NCGR_PEP_ID=MMETSP1338-20131121/114707_1 /TAXON_ID=43686 ORGANISM="Pelagodinium beii, Strain RCC1491" /NCGR_SAMPLE_ID=MMETSP1338 /ASSEMBLY_ACC=CAM_ASM_000754 /LENGTH=92 /DNA_ID=CAMNT_0043277991 /DNA_START=213 /DNA_END=491 /DNA_ORIENTATION=+
MAGKITAFSCTWNAKRKKDIDETKSEAANEAAPGQRFSVSSAVGKRKQQEQPGRRAAKVVTAHTNGTRPAGTNLCSLTATDIEHQKFATLSS